jgi:hypothetical protein
MSRRKMLIPDMLLMGERRLVRLDWYALITLLVAYHYLISYRSVLFLSRLMSGWQNLDSP